MLKKGFEVEQEEQAKEEAKKVGNLRGGSCGAYFNGMTVGTCPRVTLLRKLGFQKGIDQTTDMIFEAGRANEEYLFRLFKKSPDVLFVANDYPMIDNDTFDATWSGRTDFYVRRKDGTEFVVESKCMVSQWPLFKLVKEDKPKLIAVLQLANYMNSLKMTEGYVIYSHYFIAEKGFKEKRVRYTPKIYEWKVDISGDTITYISESGVVTDTHIKLEHLKDYYDLIEQAEADKLLPDPPAWQAFQSYDGCGYCDFSKQCEEYDSGAIDYNEFMKEIELECK